GVGEVARRLTGRSQEFQSKKEDMQMMKPELAEIAPVIGKLLRLLTSDKEGEVVAIVHALLRVLENSGLDIHDLAEALTPETVSWMLMARYCWNNRDRKQMSKSEWAFIRDLAGKTMLSDRQESELRIIFSRLRSEDADVDRHPVSIRPARDGTRQVCLRFSDGSMSRPMTLTTARRILKEEQRVAIDGPGKWAMDSWEARGGSWLRGGRLAAPGTRAAGGERVSRCRRSDLGLGCRHDRSWRPSELPRVFPRTAAARLCRGAESNRGALFWRGAPGAL